MNRRDMLKAGLAAGMAFEPAMRGTGLWETISLTVEQMWRMTTTTFSGLWHIITGAISTCAWSLNWAKRLRRVS